MDNLEPRSEQPAGAASDALQARMLAAGDTWLVWCAVHGVNPLDSTVDQIHRAALELHAEGATDTDVLDLVDQVGFMTGLWRRAEWLHLRRTILSAAGDGASVRLRTQVRVEGGVRRTHGLAQCADGVACSIHRPSRHALNSAPMARLDDLAQHDCDGCCGKETM